MCFGKISKFLVFSLTRNFWDHFPSFPCAVGTLSLPCPAILYFVGGRGPGGWAKIGGGGILNLAPGAVFYGLSDRWSLGAGAGERRYIEGVCPACCSPAESGLDLKHCPFAKGR